MDNQTRNELKRQKHADDQAAIIRLRNAQIAALQAEKGRLQRALQETPETPSVALIERIKAVQERDEARKHLHDAAARIDELLAEQRRPLTADAITDEMVERARVAYDSGQDHAGILRAALPEPTRPVTLESIVDEALDKYTGGYLNGSEVGPYVASKYAELAEGGN